MSPLIVLTVIVPFALGLAAGIANLRFSRSDWANWLVAAAIVIVVYCLLEGVPPLPPISSKHKLGFVLAAMVALAPLVTRMRGPNLLLSAVVLLTATAWMGSNKLFAAAAWPGSLWLLPLIAILSVAIGTPPRQRTAPDDLFADRLALLFSAIAGAVVALIDGFVGLGQVMGALAAATGGALIVAYAALLAGKPQWLAGKRLAADWLLGAALSAMVLITACFAPSPDPIALCLVALTPLVPRLVPALSGVKAILKPFAFGFAAMLPALAAIGIAYWNSLRMPI